MSLPPSTDHRAAWWLILVVVLIPVYFFSVEPLRLGWRRFDVKANNGTLPVPPYPEWMLTYGAPHDALFRSARRRGDKLLTQAHDWYYGWWNRRLMKPVEARYANPPPKPSPARPPVVALP